MRSTPRRAPRGLAGCLLGVTAALWLAAGSAAAAPARSAAPRPQAPQAVRALEIERAGPRAVGGALKKVWRGLDRRSARPRV